MEKKLPAIIDNKHYSFVRFEEAKDGKKIVAKCLLCKDKTISGETTSTGNFFTHLKRCHPDSLSEIEQAKKRKTDESSSTSQPKLSFMITGVTKGFQKEANRLVTNYIIKAMRPLSTVSDPSFIEMIKGLAGDKEIKVPTRYELDKNLNEMYGRAINGIKAELAGVNNVCLTADCWSSRSKAYLGVTCHWIKEDFQRVSRTLACSRFRGKHSFDKIAEKLTQIMALYEIPLEKVVSVVTDNGSNFCKAFREFSRELDQDDEEDENLESDDEDRQELVQVNEIEGRNTDFDEDSSDEDSDKIFHDSISNDFVSNSKLELPPHFRCVSHTLSLIATKREKMKKKKKNRSVYYRALGKCQKLWNLSTSPKSAEIIIAACGKNFIRPVPTRWNSLYNSISRLLEMKSGLDQVCTDLEIPKFTETDLEFLEEFSAISSPISIALDRMQGEHGVFMGSVLPTLLQTRKKLQNFAGNLKHCKTYLKEYIQGMEDRFSSLLDYDPAKPSELVCAALTHPYFKIRWAPSHQHDALKKSLLVKARHFYKAASGPKPMPRSADDDFFDFEDNYQVDTDPVELELCKYFNDPQTEIGMLVNYPTVRTMFMKYNTSLPSSAPVERLFSYGGLILSAKRSNLSDKKFEQLVVLKSNHVFA